MFGKKKEIKEIVNKKNSICWEIPLDSEKFDVSYKAVGVSLYYLKNNQIYSTVKNGETVIVNPKKDRKQNATYQLYAVGPTQDIRLDIGVCGVKFYDKDLNFDTEVGSNVTINLRVLDGWNIHKYYNDEEISVEYLQKKLVNLLKTKYLESLAAYLASKRKYDKILANTAELSEQLKNDFNELLKIDGLYLVSLGVNEIVFNDLYLKAREEQHSKENFEEIQRNKKREEERERRAMIEFVNNVNANKKDE